MTKTAYVFPGQGSQSVGMMQNWGSYQQLVDQIFEEASDALGYNLSNVVNENPDNQLNQTEVTQPAMLCSGVATWKVMQQLEGFPAASVMGGHSLGEYTALICAESLSFSDGLKLVQKRGQFMQSAVAQGQGGMAVIIGLDDDQVLQACDKVNSGVVEAANFNAPGQVVIGGEKIAIDQAMEEAKALGAKRVLPVQMSVPSHCSLMNGAADNLLQAMEDIEIAMPKIDVIHNQNANTVSSPADIKGILYKQLFHPVRWVDCVKQMKASGISNLLNVVLARY